MGTVLAAFMHQAQHIALFPEDVDGGIVLIAVVLAFPRWHVFFVMFAFGGEMALEAGHPGFEDAALAADL